MKRKLQQTMTTSPWQMPTMQQHAEYLWHSFHHWTGRWLIPDLFEVWERLLPQEKATALYMYPKPILSHGKEPDPIFNYGNRVALDLWAFTWEEFIKTPSRFSAELPNQAERATLLQQAAQHGVIENYQGIRISRTGQRFEIVNATIWTVLDDHLQAIGQAATFAQWKYLEKKRGVRI